MPNFIDTKLHFIPDAEFIKIQNGIKVNKTVRKT